MLLTLLQATAQAGKAASRINVEQILDRLLNWGIEVGKDILAAIIIYIVGRFIIRQISRLVSKILEKRKLEISVQTFLKSLLSILLNLILAFAIVSKLGVETTSFAAILASAGVAIGMALSGQLQNFAGGLIILVFKPYKVGDYIACQGTEGTVKEIQILHTILTTTDNKTIFIPNGGLSSGTVINYSRNATRRVDLTFGVEYGTTFEKVEQTLKEIIAADSRILKDPAYIIAMSQLADSSVNIALKVWVKTEDYWGVYFDLNKTVYATFNEKGIGFPFPQLTIHQG